MSEPLVVPDERSGDVEKGKEAGKLDGGLSERYHYILRTRVARVSSATTLCLLITALLVMTVGLFGGLYIYSQMARPRYQKYQTFCNVPYWDARVGSPNTNNDLSGAPVFTIPLRSEKNQLKTIDDDGVSFLLGADGPVAKFFREEVELDLEDEKYSKVEVPDFKNGRMGRFIHEFDSNKTAIVDQTAKRCFIMPLDRERVLPPKSMFDMIQKMWEGYYSVNTGRVRETMRVVLPPLEDLSDLGDYIQQECQDKTTYSLEKSTSRIIKRSISDVNELPFIEFAGKYTMEYHIVDMDQLDQAEKKQ
ncbi:unnamed protein product [Allacma fusca]|uniref:Integral membrane protein 2 n=1 Tax=Allacma fusca TaxID=39272 RepID=A0A8J2LNA6_9HEXA|nr:unnamed protein product [Allacma fusca]